MSPKVALRPFEETDEPFLFDLFRAIRAPRFDFQPGGHPQMAVMVRLQFQAQEAALASQHPGSEHSIILVDGVPVGRIRVARNENGFQVADISILPDHQGKRIGTAIMAGLMAEARQAGVPVSGTVARSNLASICFFRKLGFELTRQDASYVQMRWLPGSDSSPDMPRDETGQTLTG